MCHNLILTLYLVCAGWFQHNLECRLSRDNTHIGQSSKKNFRTVSVGLYTTCYKTYFTKYTVSMCLSVCSQSHRNHYRSHMQCIHRQIQSGRQGVRTQGVRTPSHGKLKLELVSNWNIVNSTIFAMILIS